MRILRLAWVLLTNGAAIYFLYESYLEVTILNHLLELDNRNKAVWFQFALWATIPIAGILLEFLGSRFAKWMNVGCFVAVGLFFSAIGILNWSDSHGRLILAEGLAMLAVGGVDCLLYRSKRSALPSRPGTVV
jgi:hypothetical protein